MLVQVHFRADETSVFSGLSQAEMPAVRFWCLARDCICNAMPLGLAVSTSSAVIWFPRCDKTAGCGKLPACGRDPTGCDV
jgi:hypothetical protein